MKLIKFIFKKIFSWWFIKFFIKRYNLHNLFNFELDFLKKINIKIKNSLESKKETNYVRTALLAVGFKLFFGWYFILTGASYKLIVTFLFLPLIKYFFLGASMFLKDKRNVRSAFIHGVVFYHAYRKFSIKLFLFISLYLIYFIFHTFHSFILRIFISVLVITLFLGIKDKYNDFKYFTGHSVSFKSIYFYFSFYKRLYSFFIRYNSIYFPFKLLSIFLATKVLKKFPKYRLSNVLLKYKIFSLLVAVKVYKVATKYKLSKFYYFFVSFLIKVFFMPLIKFSILLAIKVIFSLSKVIRYFSKNKSTNNNLKIFKTNIKFIYSLLSNIFYELSSLNEKKLNNYMLEVNSFFKFYFEKVKKVHYTWMGAPVLNENNNINVYWAIYAMPIQFYYFFVEWIYCYSLKERYENRYYYRRRSIFYLIAELKERFIINIAPIKGIFGEPRNVFYSFCVILYNSLWNRFFYGVKYINGDGYYIFLGFYYFYRSWKNRLFQFFKFYLFFKYIFYDYWRLFLKFLLNLLRAFLSFRAVDNDSTTFSEFISILLEKIKIVFSNIYKRFLDRLAYIPVNWTIGRGHKFTQRFNFDDFPFALPIFYWFKDISGRFLLFRKFSIIILEDNFGGLRLFCKYLIFFFKLIPFLFNLIPFLFNWLFLSLGLGLKWLFIQALWYFLIKVCCIC